MSGVRVTATVLVRLRPAFPGVAWMKEFTVGLAGRKPPVVAGAGESPSGHFPAGHALCLDVRAVHLCEIQIYID